MSAHLTGHANFPCLRRKPLRGWAKPTVVEVNQKGKSSRIVTAACSTLVSWNLVYR